MDAIQEFIDELAQHDVDLTSALRKAKMLTNDLHSPELDAWMNSELYGYDDQTKVPEYRRFPAANYGDFMGPGNSAGPNDGTPTVLFIQTENLPDEVKRFAATLVVVDPVGALALLAQEQEAVEKSWPPELIISAQGATAVPGGLFLTRAYQYIEPSVYPGIVEQVRNRLFDFMLALQSRNNATEGSAMPEAVGSMVNLHIYGNNNVVATGEQVSQQVTTTIVKGDIASLLQQMREYGIGERDILELQDAVSSEPEALPDGNYGAKVGAWLGNMLAKASTGVWDVGLETASEVLPKALKAFYGI